MDHQTGDNDSPAIRVEGLYKSYPGGIAAVCGVDLTIRVGEMVAIMGRSGSGKSTLMNLIGSLDRPDRGRVLFFGRDISKIRNLGAFRLSEIGFVFQLHYLLPHLTLLDNVALPILGRRGAIRKAREALDAVGLAARMTHVPGKVSGGERQRAAIARAIVNQPKVLLADEPTGNVDSETESELMDLFARLQRELGMTLVVVTHEPGVAARAGRIVRFKDGRIESISEQKQPGAAGGEG